MGTGAFFEEQSEASQIKTRIVSKYFQFWAKVMVGVVKRRGGNRLAYFDLYAGPGRYESGEASTPMLILEHAANDPVLSQMLLTVFNDKDPNYVSSLRDNIAATPNIDNLKHAPQVYCDEVGTKFEEFFRQTPLIPAFSFIDPFGYKGVTLELLEGMLKDFGCDLVLFFSYNGINRAIDIASVDEHITKLFGEARINRLRSLLSTCSSDEREAIILEEFSQALREMGFRFVLPFGFDREGAARTSHYLIFVSKNELGYTVMKDIMAKESSDHDQGVASFRYSKALSESDTPLLFSLDQPLEKLGGLLLSHFAGRTLSVSAIFQQHHIDRPYTKKNYKDALMQLEEAGKITAVPPTAERRRGTFADRVQVTFPETG